MLRCPAENDLADHGSVEIYREKAGAPPECHGHLALDLVTRPGATEVGAYLWRGEQLDDRRTVPGLGLTEHEPFCPDRLRRPGDGPQVCHGRRLADSQPPAGNAQLHGVRSRAGIKRRVAAT